MRSDLRDAVKSKRRNDTNGSLTRRLNGKHAQLLKSDGQSDRCERCSAEFRMNADQTETEIRVLAEERRLPAAHLERWLAFDEVSRREMLALARKVRFRTGQLVSALKLVEEIAVRERIAVAEVLGRDEIRRIADGPGSGPARASALIETLRKIRFPRLRQMQERLRAEVAALKLPRGISVDLPKELGSDELTVSLRARSADDLGRLVAALNRSSAGLARIIEMLGGEPAGDDSKDGKDEI
jgi:hypothetical protein